uniref:H15 domain-containing protein n=2 Tax=Rhizophora mucronata TaxID=61149 RepID=A0A2P2J209_RHIMU
MADDKEVEAQAPAAAEEEAIVERLPAAEDAKPADGKPAKEKKPRAPKERKARQPKAASHPPYFQMIKEALLALNEKSGSSPYAIAKYMEEKHKAVLPANFRKILALQLKNSAGRGKLIKIKASYKLSEVGKKEKSKAIAAKANAENPAKQATTTTTTTRASRAKTKSVNKPEAPKKTTKKVAASAKKAKKSASAKPKQPKSIKSPAAKRAKKATAAA